MLPATAHALARGPRPEPDQPPDAAINKDITPVNPCVHVVRVYTPRPPGVHHSGDASPTPFLLFVRRNHHHRLVRTHRTPVADMSPGTDAVPVKTVATGQPHLGTLCLSEWLEAGHALLALSAGAAPTHPLGRISHRR